MSTQRSIIAGLYVLLIGGCRADVSPDAAPAMTRAMTVPAENVLWQTHFPLPVYAARMLEPVMGLLRAPKVVESYRITPSRGEDHAQGILGYAVLARGPQLDAATAQRLTDLILDPRGYGEEFECGIQPGVAFRFIDGPHTLTVLICFKCNEWAFWLDGAKLGGGFFQELQPELLRWVQQIFPADEVLRAISTAETYGRFYLIEPSQRPATVCGEPRPEVPAALKSKIMDAVGEPADWIEAGGNKHSMRMTADGCGIIVMTTTCGHAAVAGIREIKRVR